MCRDIIVVSYLYAHILCTVAKRKIKIDPEFNFILIGMATPLQDYRVAWFVNNVLHKQLAKTDDLIQIDPINKVQTGFARFFYEETLTMATFHLLQNKQNASFLIPELKELDFLLLIKGAYYQPRKREILKKIKQIEQIQAAVIIEPELLKSKNNLIFEQNNKTDNPQTSKFN